MRIIPDWHLGEANSSVRTRFTSANRVESLDLDQWYDAPPGNAGEAELLQINESKSSGVVELWNGCLVEKIIGFPESIVSSRLIRLIGNYLEENDLGIVAGMDAGYRFVANTVLLPDVSVVLWSQLPNRSISLSAISDLPPKLTIEVMSPSNRPGELARKRQIYFAAGVAEHWEVEVKSQSLSVYTAEDSAKVYTDRLEDSLVLKGMVLSISTLFTGLIEQA